MPQAEGLKLSREAGGDASGGVVREMVVLEGLKYLHEVPTEDREE